MARAAGGTSQRLKPGFAMMRSLESSGAKSAVEEVVVTARIVSSGAVLVAITNPRFRVPGSRFRVRWFQVRWFQVRWFQVRWFRVRWFQVARSTFGAVRTLNPERGTWNVEPGTWTLTLEYSYGRYVVV